jgi:serine/threonine-protein kinase ATR
VRETDFNITGIFRRACEVTLTLLRDNIDSLMSVLETFVHDPLVEWDIKVRKKAKVKFCLPSESFVIDSQFPQETTPTVCFG